MYMYIGSRDVPILVFLPIPIAKFIIVLIPIPEIMKYTLIICNLFFVSKFHVTLVSLLTFLGVIVQNIYLKSININDFHSKL